MNNKTQYIKPDNDFEYKEKRSDALTVRLPPSILKKIKKISKKYNYSQSEVVETLVLRAWKDINENESEN